MKLHNDFNSTPCLSCHTLLRVWFLSCLYTTKQIENSVSFPCTLSLFRSPTADAVVTSNPPLRNVCYRESCLGSPFLLLDTVLFLWYQFGSRTIACVAVFLFRRLGHFFVLILLISCVRKFLGFCSRKWG